VKRRNKEKLIMDKNVHLICKTGEKIVVPHKDYNDSEMLKDGKYDDYDITGKIGKYVTLEEFMVRTAYIEEGQSDENK
jgi:hypothetical protein